MKSVRILFAALLFAFALTPAVVRAEDVDASHAAEATAETSHADAAEEEGGGSMPQLDPTYYVSQLFWLVLSGGVLYGIMSKLALPRVAKMVDERDNRVRADLEAAYKLKQEAEDLKIAYSKALRDSDERSKTLMEKTVRDMRDKQAKGLEEAVARIDVKVQAAEKHLRSEKDALINESAIISERLAKSVLQEFAKGRAA